jgi:hypothetical protein
VGLKVNQSQPASGIRGRELVSGDVARILATPSGHPSPWIGQHIILLEDDDDMLFVFEDAMTYRRHDVANFLVQRLLPGSKLEIEVQ